MTTLKELTLEGVGDVAEEAASILDRLPKGGGRRKPLKERPYSDPS